MSFRIHFFSTLNLQFYLTSTVILNLDVFNMQPPPPFLWLTHVFLFNPSYFFFYFQRKFLCIFLIAWNINVGALEKDKQYNGKVMITYLIRQIRAAKVQNLPFHIVSLVLT